MLQKAKVPATAAGIALIGIAGGLTAAGRGGGKRSTLLPGGRGPKLPQVDLKNALPQVDLKKALKRIPMPKPDGSTIDWVEEKAKDLGDTGYRVAELASEARQVKNAVTGED